MVLVHSLSFCGHFVPKCVIQLPTLADSASKQVLICEWHRFPSLGVSSFSPAILGVPSDVLYMFLALYHWFTVVCLYWCQGLRFWKTCWSKCSERYIHSAKRSWIFKHKLLSARILHSWAGNQYWTGSISFCVNNESEIAFLHSLTSSVLNDLEILAHYKEDLAMDHPLITSAMMSRAAAPLFSCL